MTDELENCTNRLKKLAFFNNIMFCVVDYDR